MTTVTTAIHFSTKDYRFINHSIKQASLFSKQVIVTVCQSFANGQPENRYLLNKVYEANPRATFVEYPYCPKLVEKYGTRFLRNAARWIAIKRIAPVVDFVLFLNADEVVEGRRFKDWLENAKLARFDSVKFLNNWYFRDPSIQSKHIDTHVVMARRSLLVGRHVFRDDERHGLMLGKKLLDVTGLNSKPMIHKYNWVRTKVEMRDIVGEWDELGSKERWQELVETEFSEPIDGVLSSNSFEFKTVEPLITLSPSLTEKLPIKSADEKQFPNRTLLSEEEFLTTLTKRSLIRRLFKRP